MVRAKVLAFTSLVMAFLVVVPSAHAASPDALEDFDRLWDYDHPDATEKKFRALLPAAERAANFSYELQLLTQIARCQGLQGKFDECQATLDSVERRLTDDFSVARIRYLLERGRAFNSADHPDKAMPFFVKAWEKAKDAGEDGYAIDAAHMVAIAEPNLERQIEWNRRALALAERSSKQQDWIPTILNNLGESYRASGKYSEALDCFQRQAQWSRDRHEEVDIYTTKDIARMNRMLGHPDVALKLIEPVAKDLKSHGKPDGYISAEYGQCLYAMGRRDEARPFLVEAYQLLSKDDYMVKNEPEELKHIKELSGFQE